MTPEEALVLLAAADLAKVYPFPLEGDLEHQVMMRLLETVGYWRLAQAAKTVGREVAADSLRDPLNLDRLRTLRLGLTIDAA